MRPKARKHATITDHGGEERALKRLGAKPTKNSGSTDKDKGDGHLGRFKLEIKSTVREEFRLRFAELNKIAYEAYDTDALPAFLFQFIQGNGHPKVNGNWVCLPEDVFKELVGD